MEKRTPGEAVSWSRKYLLDGYTDEEVVERLVKAGRDKDAEVYRRWIEVKRGGGNYKDLKGGNVVFTGGTEREEKANQDNEFARVCRIDRSSGRLAPDLYYLLWGEYQDIVKWSEGET
jgi:hypothetical protein